MNLKFMLQYEYKIHLLRGDFMSKLLSSLFFDNPEIPEQICQFCQSIPEYVQAREEYHALAQELEETMGRQWYFTFEDRLN